ncbi:hypothetical protein ACFQZR_05540 [Paenibacillus sp. GCM10027629]|uniref:hypothetical protein n=1 Tax=Paenibacillus sp. GCM10027629 TaxID=3273414 RepID=UPI003632EBAC
MKKFAAVVLSACLLLSVASVASAAPAHETKHKMHAKSTHKHKMHAKSAHKGKKLHAKSHKKGHMKMKGLTPKALPKTGFGGVSE